MLFTGVDDGHFRNMQQEAGKRLFTRYQVFIISILTILQFTVVLDFMVLSPLGAILLDELHIEPSRFGLVVSAYAFSAAFPVFWRQVLPTSLTGKTVIVFLLRVHSGNRFMCDCSQLPFPADSPDHHRVVWGR